MRKLIRSIFVASVGSLLFGSSLSTANAAPDTDTLQRVNALWSTPPAEKSQGPHPYYLHQQFEAEARDANWAKAREEILRREIGRDATLANVADKLSVECKTSMCEIALALPTNYESAPDLIEKSYLSFADAIGRASKDRSKKPFLIYSGTDLLGYLI